MAQIYNQHNILIFTDGDTQYCYTQNVREPRKYVCAELKNFLHYGNAFYNSVIIFGHSVLYIKV